MKRPTSKQISAEIAALEKCKAYVPRWTTWREDNNANIDRAIEYLRGDLAIDSPKFHRLNERDQEAVYEAQRWQDGESKETPSSGWDLYKPKKKRRA